MCGADAATESSPERRGPGDTDKRDRLLSRLRALALTKQVPLGCARKSEKQGLRARGLGRGRPLSQRP